MPHGYVYSSPGILQTSGKDKQWLGQWLSEYGYEEQKLKEHGYGVKGKKGASEYSAASSASAAGFAPYKGAKDPAAAATGAGASPWKGSSG